MSIKSPLIWFGGKSKSAPEIIKYFPNHKYYVEPFGGAAHVLTQKPRSLNEVYNDIDANVTNFLLQIANDTEKFKHKCLALPYSRTLYEKWKREPWPEDDFERSIRWFYLNRSGISKGNSEQSLRSTGWSFSLTANQTGAYVNVCERLGVFAERMRGVMLECADFREIILRYDSPDTLFYVDPPYIGREKYYAGGFKEQEHHDLADILNQIQGKAILSYYNDPLLDELYPAWHRETFQAARQVVNGNNNTAEELLLMNFDNAQLTLF